MHKTLTKNNKDYGIECKKMIDITKWKGVLKIKPSSSNPMTSGVQVHSSRQSVNCSRTFRDEALLSSEMVGSNSNIEDIVGEVSDMVKDTLEQLGKTWQQIYDMTDECRQKKFQQFVEYTKDFFKELILSQEKRKLKLIEEIENKKEEFKQLEKDLKTTINLNIEGSMPLNNYYMTLDNTLDEYRKIRDERIVAFEKLQKEEEMLCKILEEDRAEPLSGFPSQTDLEDMEHRIFNLLQEKCEREQIVSEAKVRLQECLNSLEKEPMLQFEKEIIEGNYLITATNMTKLKDWEHCLKVEIEMAQENKKHLLAKLTRLWDRINVNNDYRVQFLGINSGIGKSTINNIFSELERCDAIAMADIKTTILSAKKELEGLWEKMKFSESQKSEFQVYSTDIYTDEILELYELEIERLKMYYNNNLPLYEMVETWEELWEKLLQLEITGKDKSRLKNRGGQLLKEEKERNAINKTLPRVYAELVTLLKEHNSRESKPFRWNDYDLLQKITDDWNQKLENENKKPNKSARRLAHKRELLSADSSSELVPYTESEDAKTPRLRRVLTESNMRTPLKSTPLKRQFPTPFTTPAKRVCKMPLQSATPSEPVRLTRKGTPLKPGRTPMSSKQPSAATPCTPMSLRFTPARKFNLNI
ncbi:protein regulator of cytokinesis 1-like isoform X2 [Cimex lectularius]|uniref:Protein regulator of cytokinesis 1 n=1 Tax=Cimex lectularius TaxID=79782 RepID=A0A8I6TCX0_CIMLE|nr:protein regulator of cytokinesis 1-like isoform X2 [Cimex lectularius]